MPAEGSSRIGPADVERYMMGTFGDTRTSETRCWPNGRWLISFRLIFSIACDAPHKFALYQREMTDVMPPLGKQFASKMQKLPSRRFPISQYVL